MTVGIIRRKPVLTHASIVFGGLLASVNSMKLVRIHGVCDRQGVDVERDLRLLHTIVGRKIFFFSRIPEKTLNFPPDVVCFGAF